MIGVLGDQHLGDQRLGWNAAFDDPRRCRGLDHRALARAATVARPTRDQHPERGRHHIEPLGDILADPVERAAAAGAGLVLDIDDLLDPFEVRGQRTAVGLARMVGAGSACLLLGVLSFGQRRLDFLKAELELIGIELLGTAPEAVALEGLDDRPQALDLGLENLERIEITGLFENERTKRFNVIGKVRFHEHGDSESADQSHVNRQFAAPAVGARHARAAIRRRTHLRHCWQASP